MLNTLTGAVPSPSGAQAITQNDLVAAGVASLDQSGNLAPAPSAISTALQFAQALQSIGVVSSLPALPDALYPIGAQVVLTTDGKLYRNVGGTWSKSVDGADLIAQSVAGSSIINGAIGTTQIANQAITASQLALSSVTTPALATGAVTAAILAANAVTYQALAAGAVDATKFATGQAPVAVNNGLPNPTGYTGPLTLLNTADGKLYRYLSASSTWTRAVDGADLTANSVTAGSITAGAITATALAAGAVTTAALAAGSVTTGVIAAGAVTTPLIAAGAITANQLAANSVTAGAISAGAVNAAAISVSSLSAISANLGTITAGTLQDSAGRFVVNLNSQTQTITDSTGRTRVLIGNTGSDYGIAIYDSSGNKLFDPVQGAWDPATGQATSSAITTVSVQLRDAGNLVKKSTFDDGSKGNWTGSLQAISGNAYNGHKYMLVTNLNGVGTSESGNSFTASAGDQFDVSAYCWASALSSGSYSAMSIAFTLNDGSISYVEAFHVDSTGAVSAPVRITAPANSISGSLLFINNSTTGSIWLSEITCRKVTNAELANASATQSLTTSVNTLTNKVDATYTLQLNANGYVSGIVAQNNGTVSNLTIVADNFAITPSSGTGLRTEFSAGNWRVYDANNVLRVRLGIW